MSFIPWLLALLNPSRLLAFFSTTIGKVVLIAVAVLGAYWWGGHVQRQKCEARIEESVKQARAMDQKVAAEAEARMAGQIQSAETRAKSSEEKLNAYLERNKSNPACVAGDDDLRQFDVPDWLRRPYFLPNPGPAAPKR
jgi:uncharacterized protein HemX